MWRRTRAAWRCSRRKAAGAAFQTERPSEQSIVSNVYKGRVHLDPARHGRPAFIDIGIDKAGFLHVDDVLYDLLAALPLGWRCSQAQAAAASRGS